jgi:hypothetical protein
MMRHLFNAVFVIALIGTFILATWRPMSPATESATNELPVKIAIGSAD